MTEAAHSRLGASSAERWLNCPGSVALAATQPSPPESPYAKEGTAAHAVGEMCLNAGYDPHDFVGRLVKGVEITPEIADAVKVYVDHVRELAADGVKLVKVEQRVTLKEFDAELFGTTDCSLVTLNRVLHVIDYKHGAGVPVNVEGNKQGQFYALGSLLAAHAEGIEIDRVVITIVQPRCTQAGDPVRSWETTPDALMDFGFELAFGAEAARAPDAPLNAGKHCRWCPAKGTCPKLYEDALAVAGVELNGDGEPLPITSMTSEELGRRLDMADALEEWLRAIRAHSIAEAKAGRMPAGRKLVATRGRREWRDAEDAMQMAMLNFNFLEESYLYTRKPISPAQFERLVGRTEAKPIIEALTEVKAGGVSLVPLSDKRPPVAPSAIADFADLETTDD